MKLSTRFWIIGSMAAAVLMLGIPFAGCMLVIGGHLSAIHPWLAWLFYGTTPLALLAPPVYWLVRILKAPRWRPFIQKISEKRHASWKDRWQVELGWRDSAMPDKSLMDLAAFHARHAPTLAGTDDEEKERRILSDLDRMARTDGEWTDFQNIRSALAELKKMRSEHAHTCIRKYTRRVFLSTSISQKGVADAWITLVLNMKMAQEVVRLYGMRPSLWNVCKLVRATCAVSFLSYSAQDVLEDKLLAAPLETVSNAPLIGWLLKPLISSCVNGCLNGVLTMRIGYVVESLITDGLPENEAQCKGCRRKVMELVMKDFYRTLKEPMDQLKERLLDKAQKVRHDITVQVKQSVSSAFHRRMKSAFSVFCRKEGESVPENDDFCVDPYDLEEDSPPRRGDGQMAHEETCCRKDASTDPVPPKRKWRLLRWWERKEPTSSHEDA